MGARRNFYRGGASPKKTPYVEKAPPPPPVNEKRSKKASYEEQDVREGYAYFFPEQECDPVTVLVWINLILLLR